MTTTEPLLTEHLTWHVKREGQSIAKIIGAFLTDTLSLSDDDDDYVKDDDHFNGDDEKDDDGWDHDSKLVSIWN